MQRRIGVFAAILATVGAATFGAGAAAGAVQRAGPVSEAVPARTRVAAAQLAAVGEAWFYGASCPAVKLCMAVGIKATPTGGDTLVEEWAGGRWRVLPTPNPAGFAQSALLGVSCISAAACVAAGSGLSQSVVTSTAVAEQWNGRRWRMIPPRTSPGTKPGLLDTVWCRPRWGCLALGYDIDKANNGQPLAERWTGSRWVLLPGLSPAFFADDVSCAGSACMAVGVTNQPGTGNIVPFSERWDGRRWHALSMPVPRHVTATQDAAVSCPSTSRCLAVGYSNTNNSVPFAELWTGTGWHLLRLPAGTPAATQLFSLSCPAVNECVAVGGLSSGAARSAPVALAWNGRAWRMLRVPGPLSIVSQFYGVSCPGTRGCLAVGLIRTGQNQIARTIAEWWNGQTWHPLRLPA